MTLHLPIQKIFGKVLRFFLKKKTEAYAIHHPVYGDYYLTYFTLWIKRDIFPIGKLSFTHWLCLRIQKKTPTRVQRFFNKNTANVWIHTVWLLLFKCNPAQFFVLFVNQGLSIKFALSTCPNKYDPFKTYARDVGIFQRDICELHLEVKYLNGI